MAFTVEPIGVVYARRAEAEDDFWGDQPNRIGSTICRVVKVDGNALVIAELDAIDGTPVVDIKPVMQELLPRKPVRQPAWSRELMADYWRRR